MPRTAKEKQAARKAGYRRRQQSSDKRRAEKLERYAKRHASEFGDKPLEVLKKQTWEHMRTLLAEPRGDAARLWLDLYPDPLFAGYIRMAALIPIDADTNYYSWGDYRARAVVALGCLLWGQRIPSGRDDHWTTLVEGLTREVICGALEDPHTGMVPGLTFLTGTYGWCGRWNTRPFDRGGGTGPGCGILTALKQLGVLYSDQWQGQRYAARDDDYGQPNQYFITHWLPASHPLPERVIERMAVLMHEVALQALDEQGTRQPSRHSRAPP